MYVLQPEWVKLKLVASVLNMYQKKKNLVPVTNIMREGFSDQHGDCHSNLTKINLYLCLIHYLRSVLFSYKAKWVNQFSCFRKFIGQPYFQCLLIVQSSYLKVAITAIASVFWPVTFYIQPFSSTCEGFSFIWGWPEKDGYGRQPHYSTMWGVRPYWTSQLVQGWNKAAIAKWSRPPVTRKFAESSCPISRAGSYWHMSLWVTECWHPVCCESKK